MFNFFGVRNYPFLCFAYNVYRSERKIKFKHLVVSRREATLLLILPLVLRFHSICCDKQFSTAFSNQGAREIRTGQEVVH